MVKKVITMPTPLYSSLVGKDGGTLKDEIRKPAATRFVAAVILGGPTQEDIQHPILDGTKEVQPDEVRDHNDYIYRVCMLANTHLRKYSEGSEISQLLEDLVSNTGPERHKAKGFLNLIRELEALVEKCDTKYEDYLETGRKIATLQEASQLAMRVSEKFREVTNHPIKKQLDALIRRCGNV